MNHSRTHVLCGLVLIGVFSSPAITLAEPAMERVARLNSGPNNPRNSEGDLIQLNDGRLLFIYTRFTGGYDDHASAHLASRVSTDGGQSWSTSDRTVIENEGAMNIMSVSLLRLQDKRIAMFYSRKNSLQDCRPLMRISCDEAQTWGPPVEIIPAAEKDYYVLNNARVVQLTNGRLLAPVARHLNPTPKKFNPDARILCYYSDDAGQTWKCGQEAKYPASADKNTVCQEPGVIELNDGRLMVFCRTNLGSQCVAYSADAGATWSQLQTSAFISPRSPATIVRVPKTGDLLAVWNDHAKISAELRDKRTPLSAAISQDDGKTWQPSRTLEDHPHGWYCYTAARFVGDHVLLAYCAGNQQKGAGLADTQITRIPLAWLYAEKK
jgi:hypothetical protein